MPNKIKYKLACKILNVDEGSDNVTIKKAFWILAMQYHPDKCPNNEEAQKCFINIVNAYEFLIKGKEYNWKNENSDEKQIGEYLANEWGYFCWWKDSFL
jgi:DnaJ-class molecular chaperone